ncbi:hypothetical protein [Zunongwangia endophytica]|uniref:TonB-dependent receptor plug domain-containing protein n=1 Tax=Zunongwangia endophytica TaxID=1808945 RepID=A0ABV8HAG2_9FLAO|nr:hypothetical protein [Zunongwangia endophytica]MDN3594778.1 hypothetical protein [Zunongwangia endophytica]
MGICLALFNIPLIAQEDRLVSDAAYAEKIYLQTDRNYYFTESTIWFKALVLNNLDHKPSERSGVLHVDLIGPDKQLVSQKLVKIINGSGHNSFELPATLSEGTYKIRAFTRWNRNFGQDFIFSKYITIYPKSSIDEKVISDVKIVEQNEGNFLKAIIQPKKLDSLHGNKILVGLNFNGTKTDSVALKKVDDSFVLDYKLSGKPDFVSIELKTDNGFRAARTIGLETEKIDLQFLPESGKMLSGYNNVLGIKVLDFKGDGRYTEGIVIDENQDTISSFKANDLGMGMIIFRPEKGEIYTAKITNTEVKTEAHKIPEAIENGAILSVRKSGSRIGFIATNTHDTDSLTIRCSFRGVNMFDIKGKVTNNQFNTSIASSKFPSGINCFTLLNQNQIPVAERLFFNDQSEDDLKIEVESDQKEYLSREETNLSIVIKDKNGNPVEANFSVLSVANDHLETNYKKHNSILSHFYLTSELRGEIEDPGSYFNRDDAYRFRDIDVLLLTQGWRNYKYDTSSVAFNFYAEPILTLEGTVKSALFQKVKENVEMSLMSFGDQPILQTSETDSLGKFYFNIDDLENDSNEIVIQSKKKGNKRNFDIEINRNEPPLISFEERLKIEKPDSVYSEIIKQERQKFQKIKSYEMAEGITELDEVVVEAYNMTEERQKTADLAGKPDVVIKGSDIQEKEKDWSYGLYSVLLFNFPNDIRIQRDIQEPGASLSATVMGGAGVTIMMIDGIVVNNLNYPLIPNIPPSEVKSVEIIRFAKNFSRLFTEAYPYANPREIPPQGDVIAIYTHGKKGIFGAQKPKGILRTSVSGFAKSKSFYQPNYQNKDRLESEEPDLRTIIYWEPEVAHTPEAPTEISFYNPDDVEEVLVIIEVITKNGQIGYKEFLYPVKSSDQVISN